MIRDSIDSIPVVPWLNLPPRLLCADPEVHSGRTVRDDASEISVTAAVFEQLVEIINDQFLNDIIQLEDGQEMRKRWPFPIFQPIKNCSALSQNLALAYLEMHCTVGRLANV